MKIRYMLHTSGIIPPERLDKLIESKTGGEYFVLESENIPPFYFPGMALNLPGPIYLNAHLSADEYKWCSDESIFEVLVTLPRPDMSLTNWEVDTMLGAGWKLIA